MSLPNPIDQTADGIFFIVGCGRSGTTLLQVMLDSHSEIALPNETHFYSAFYKRQGHKFGNLETHEQFDRALQHVMQNEHIRALGVDAHDVARYAKDRKPSWETLFLALMTAFRVDRKAERVGEKTPSHIGYMDRLYREFPGAKFIHIIRDPRAVVQSYMKAGFYKNFGKNPFHAINAWRSALEVHFSKGVTLDPSRYTTVRYEDLVSQPREELARLCAFLGVDFEESMLEFHSRSYTGFLEGESHKLGTLKPVYKESTEKWRETLPAPLHQLIDTALGPYMQKLGYPVEKAAPGWKADAQMKWLLLSYKTRVRTRRLLQMAKLIKPSELGGIAGSGAEGGSNS